MLIVVTSVANPFIYGPFGLRYFLVGAVCRKLGKKRPTTASFILTRTSPNSDCSHNARH